MAPGTEPGGADNKPGMTNDEERWGIAMAFNGMPGTARLYRSMGEQTPAAGSLPF